MGYEVTSEMTHHLMDGVDPTDTEAAVAAASDIPGVLAATARGRWMGRSLMIEVEGALDPVVQLSDACETGNRVELAVLAAVPAARRVLWRPVLAVGPNDGPTAP